MNGEGDGGGGGFDAMESDAPSGARPGAKTGDPVLPCEKPPRGKLRIQLRDEHLQLYANCPFTLKAGGETVEGDTGEKGLVEAEVPADAAEGTLTVTIEGADGEPRDVTWELAINAMDPVSLVTGIQSRLRNLYFYGGAVDGDDGLQTKMAIAGFQHWVGLNPTGEMDGDTKEALDEMYDAGKTDFEPRGFLGE